MQRVGFIYDDKRHILAFAVPRGTPVYAIASGIASFPEQTPSILRIQHEGYLTYDNWIYGDIKPLSHFPLQESFQVVAGERIGEVKADKLLLMCYVTTNEKGTTYKHYEHPVKYLAKYRAMYPGEIELTIGATLGLLASSFLLGGIAGYAATRG